jgi:hypothetical protein
VKALEEVTILYIIFGGLFKKRNNTSASSDDSLILVKQDNIPGQNLEAKGETAKDHAEGKPSSETLNKAKVKGSDVVQDVKRDL